MTDSISRPLAFDRHNLAELHALQGDAILRILDEMLGELKRLADLKVEAIGERAAAKIAAINANRKPLSDPDFIRWDAQIQKLTAIIKARSDQAKIVQTKVNASVRI